ncbi:SA1320 family protein [Gemella haemolysans]|nr:DUF2974 domain-containing protein [Gemella haemolysans]KAA8707971.1 DUF2974 domain-containing protein [Gemella haemolysans]UBH81947.1 hypothetical protein LA340_06345 [Gemella haemolysans]VEI38138.1 Uncharacterised protein [Gemella haemolysans]
MKNNTLYASNLTYEFEKARISGDEDEKVLETVVRKMKGKYPNRLEYLRDFYDKDTGSSGTAFKDKDTGEVILAYTGTNFDNDKWNDAVKTDFGRIALGLGDGHVDPARKFYEEIRAEYGDDIILTGHSLGGNLAQWIALHYNVQKTIVYNPAPLYIPPEQLVAGSMDPGLEKVLNQVGLSLKDAVAIPLGYIKDEAKWLFGIKTGEDKIKNLKEIFTGRVIRIQSEADVLNNVSDYLKGEYLGVEHILKNSGWHLLGNILNSEELKEELEKITGQLYKIKPNIDIDGDGKIDVKLGELDLKRRNLLDDKASIVSEGKIQLNPEVLRTLSSNIGTKVINDLEIIKNITKLCIEKNNKVRMDFNQRKEQVTESIQEELNNIGIPLILDNLRESVGEIIKNKDSLSNLQSYHELKMEFFSINEKPIVKGYELNPAPYNNQLGILRHAVEPLLTQSIKEETRDISNLFRGKPTILKSWQEIENNIKRLLEESDKTFEGDGLRTGKEDGISQSLKQVLEVAGKNIEELEKQLQNTVELTQGLAENFEEQDRWIGTKLQQGIFLGSNPVKNMPQSYKAYLERDEIFDDVKDVIQAFDKQVEKRSKEYAKKMAEIIGDSLVTLVSGLENWLRFVDDAKSAIVDVEGNYPLTVEVEEKYTEEYQEEGETKTTTKTRIRYWGEFKRLYPEIVVDNITDIQDKIISKKAGIVQTIQVIKTTQNNLGYLEPNLKKIIEEGIYKAFDLDEIVNSQKIVKRIIEKSQSEIKYVKEHIGTEGMSGEAIKALNQKLEEVNRSLEYYKMFIGDCFGDQA